MKYLSFVRRAKSYFSRPTIVVGGLFVFAGAVSFHLNVVDADASWLERIARDVAYSTSTAPVFIFIELWFRRLNKRPSLNSLRFFADLWGLNLRKKIKALAGDYDVEIARLHKQRRYKTAQWNRILAWGYAIWYVLRGPLDWVTDYLISAVKGR